MVVVILMFAYTPEPSTYHTYDCCRSTETLHDMPARYEDWNTSNSIWMIDGYEYELYLDPLPDSDPPSLTAPTPITTTISTPGHRHAATRGERNGTIPYCLHLVSDSPTGSNRISMVYLNVYNMLPLYLLMSRSSYFALGLVSVTVAHAPLVWHEQLVILALVAVAIFLSNLVLLLPLGECRPGRYSYYEAMVHYTPVDYGFMMGIWMTAIFTCTILVLLFLRIFYVRLCCSTRSVRSATIELWNRHGYGYGYGYVSKPELKLKLQHQHQPPSYSDSTALSTPSVYTNPIVVFTTKSDLAHLAQEPSLDLDLDLNLDPNQEPQPQPQPQPRFNANVLRPYDQVDIV